jgi:hypothetical protein
VATMTQATACTPTVRHHTPGPLAPTPQTPPLSGL